MNNMPILNNVSLQRGGIYLDGQATILLSASLFYFRIPRGLWHDRMVKLKKAGYNTIDVYFPWNYHETREEEWDFSGEKDIAAFLKMAADEELYVIARPGPYICSEWDGGALPAYLFTNTSMKLRDDDSHYLQAVTRWFDRILPILRTYQYGEEGSIVCVQLENELDFYACEYPERYISALRDMTLQHGIEVPLIACAGQGDLERASGYADQVAPACNFYPTDKQANFEEVVKIYASRLADRNLPLLVTETNRSHYLLRRLLMSGAKLLGPYLQVSGTDFGFTNGINNWGFPLALLTSDYDFGGMISPEGYPRPEANEGRMLGRLIDTYGSMLAESLPMSCEGIMISQETAESTSVSVSGPHAVRFPAGGRLFSLANLTNHDEAVRITLDTVGGPVSLPFQIDKDTCPIFPLGLDLTPWGVVGTLDYANAELFWVKREASGVSMIFHAEGTVELGIRLHRRGREETPLEELNQGSLKVVRLNAREAKHRSIILTDDLGVQLNIVVLTRSEALQLYDIVDGSPVYDQWVVREMPSSIPMNIDWSTSELAMAKPLFDGTRQLGNETDYLEKHGVYRGYAWYEAEFARLGKLGCQGFLLEGTGDIISVYANDEYLGTHVPGGSSVFIPSYQEAGAGISMSMRTEIWGHTNFDAPQIPSLALHSMKGITALTAITQTKQLSDHWRFKSAQYLEPNELSHESAQDCDDSLWTITGWGGWLDTSPISRGWYRKKIELLPDADSHTLLFSGLKAMVTVYVNGRNAGLVNPHNPYLSLNDSYYGDHVMIACYTERHFGSSLGEVVLYEGTRAEHWKLTAGEEPSFWAHAEHSRIDAKAVLLPYRLTSGRTAWLFGDVPNSAQGQGWRVHGQGKNIKLSAYFNGRLVGRLWTPESTSRPNFSGGNQSSFYLPGVWFDQENTSQLAIYLEAVDVEEDGLVEALTFCSI
jgi:beta-galactosidase